MTDIEPPDLFSDQAPAGPVSKARSTTKPNGYAAFPGTGPADKTCADCGHCRRFSTNRAWHKCALTRGKWTSGRGTDILVTAPACSRFDQAQPPAVESAPRDDISGAEFSPCQRYRYRLWRRFAWESDGHLNGANELAFLMLNPSTADATDNDPTIERCTRRARSMGFRGLQVVNLFALRSTDPKALYAADDPVGAGNDSAIVDVCRAATMVICAWGAHGLYRQRDRAVVKMLREAGVQLHALKVNADGSPSHPLYLPYTVEPSLYIS